MAPGGELDGRVASARPPEAGAVVIWQTAHWRPEVMPPVLVALDHAPDVDPLHDVVQPRGATTGVEPRRALNRLRQTLQEALCPPLDVSNAPCSPNLWQHDLRRILILSHLQLALAHQPLANPRGALPGQARRERPGLCRCNARPPCGPWRGSPGSPSRPAAQQAACPWGNRHPDGPKQTKTKRSNKRKPD